ncbi:hypothetical protein PAEPH01_0234 [Pancytospora epiphaga]|nr:hypothetical protein PAEPH01_0234 [Pancytospora epiphaga]
MFPLILTNTSNFYFLHKEVPMETSVFIKMKKCIRYKDYDTAIFLCTYLLCFDARYRLLLGVLLYENGDISRCIYHLEGLSTTTALYYKALAYKHQKKYENAICCLTDILEGRSSSDAQFNHICGDILVNSSDMAYFEALSARMHVLNGNGRKGGDIYRKSLFAEPLLDAVEYLFDEGNRIELISDFAGDPVLNYYNDLFHARSLLGLMNKNWVTGKSPVFVPEANKVHSSVFLPTVNGIPFDIGKNSADYFNMKYFGAYYISKLAVLLIKFGNENESCRLFELVRKHDPYFIHGMDGYSIVLWKQKEENLLGLLAKSFISSHPNHHITWMIIGNYYSILCKLKESCLCFNRSISILESPQAYSLLGFECNAKSQYAVAQKHFGMSLLMAPSSDIALFGLGIAHAGAFKPDYASRYFLHALEQNPYSLNMVIYLVRFWVKNRELNKAADKMIEILLGSLPEGGTDYDSIVRTLERRSGTFTDIEELVICEFVEILSVWKYKGLARRLLQIISNRSSTYGSKKALIEGLTSEN